MKRLAWMTAATVVALAGASTAAAAPPPYGGLTQRPGAAGCITNGPLAPCATFNGFYYPSDALVTPDGKQLMLVDPGYNAIVTYNRAADGSLTYGSCVSQDGSESQPCTTNAFLGQVNSLAISPNGQNVYAITGNGTLLTFARSSAGALTLNHCFSATGSLLCSAAHGLSGAQSISLASDGSLLVVGGDHALSVFSRSLADGTLTARGCVGDGTDAGCTNGGGGYDDLEGVAVAPDSRAVYGAARAGSSLLVVGYDPASATLTPRQCLSNPVSLPAGCTAVGALFAPNWIAVSPNGSGAPDVYTADYNAGEIATFARAADDTLTWVSCRSFTGDVGGTPAICTHDYRLQHVSRAMVGPDGRNLYTLAGRSNPDQGSQDIAIYGRDLSTGAITPLPDPNSCWATPDEGSEGACQIAHGLRDPVAMALSPAGDQLYAAVNPDNVGIGSTPGGIAIFNRELPPTCTPASASTPAGAPVTLTLSCAGSNGLPVAVSILAAPSHGQLGAIGPAGQVRFTPPPGFAGVVAFTFTASDGSLTSSPASATVDVIASPVHTPALSRLRISPRRFAVRQPRHHRRVRLGTSIAWTDNLAATTTLSVTGSATGVARGGRCLAPPRHPSRGARRCRRTVGFGSLVHTDRVGANSLRFAGRLGRRLLPAGRYRLTLRARLAGRASRAVSAAFTVTS